MSQEYFVRVAWCLMGIYWVIRQEPILWGAVMW